MSQLSLPNIKYKIIKLNTINPTIVVSSRPLVILFMFGILLIMLGLEENFICTRNAPQNATKAIAIISKDWANPSRYTDVKGKNIDTRTMLAITTIFEIILAQLILMINNLFCFI